MKIVVFGKGDRAKACLRAMVEAGFKPIAVLAQKNDQISAEESLELDIPLLNSEEDIFSLKPDLLILISYTRILKEPMISFSRLGTINLHGGPLPDYRGASVLNWQIINGEKAIGLTILFVDEGIDTGDIIAEDRFPIAFRDSIADVVKKANEIFPRLLVKVLRDFTAGSVSRTKQQPGGKYYHKRRPEDGLIRWGERDVLSAYNFIRALTRPYPGAFSILDGRKVIFWSARISEDGYKIEPGKIIAQEPQGFIVAANQSSLLVTDFEVEGMKLESARNFISDRVGKTFSG